ncbi:hypothetical protein GCM10010353_68130 [Streptomyces chryseus]|nr:hypothetical protein GCM10010353_68130 [Streptomyces chryseus]
MSSCYNLVGRPPVVAVADGHARLLVRRETLDDPPGPRHRLVDPGGPKPAIWPGDPSPGQIADRRIPDGRRHEGVKRAPSKGQELARNGRQHLIEAHPERN